MNCGLDSYMYSRCLQDVQKSLESFCYKIGHVEIPDKHTKKSWNYTWRNFAMEIEEYFCKQGM